MQFNCSHTKEFRTLCHLFTGSKDTCYRFQLSYWWLFKVTYVVDRQFSGHLIGKVNETVLLQILMCSC